MEFLLMRVHLAASNTVSTSGHLQKRCSSPFIFSSVVICMTPFSFVNTKDITKKRKVQRESGQFAFSFNFLSFFCHFSEREPFSPCFEYIQRTDRDGGGKDTTDTMSVVQITIWGSNDERCLSVLSAQRITQESQSPERIEEKAQKNFINIYTLTGVVLDDSRIYAPIGYKIAQNC